MTFDEIIESVGFEDIIKATQNPNAFLFEDMAMNYSLGKIKREGMPISLTSNEQQYNIAVYARLISEHVGFDSFDEKNIVAFKSKIEEFYNGAKDTISIKEFAVKLKELGSRYIQDEHCLLYTSFEELGNTKEEAKKRQEELESMENYRALNRESSAGHELYWEIGSIQQNGQKILLVRIPFLGMKQSYEDWEQFIKTFDGLYGQQGENWDRIILDVRGNGGGEDKPIAHIAQRTYGNRVNSYKRCEIRDTPIGDFLLKTHGMYARHCPKDLEVLPRQSFSGKKRALFDQTEKYYTFNEAKGYQGEIDVLFDRHVGSSAESAHTLFLHHPRVLFIGENTKGMQQYQQGWANLPCGFGLRVACTKLTYYDEKGENIECIGHEPDIRCESKDALQVALTTEKKGFQHKLNEVISPFNYCPAPNGINPYDPKGAEDRRAYYAQFVEPAVEKVEFENIIGSLSKEDLITPEAPKGKDEMLTVAEQRKMLAFMGRFLYNGHGGFADGNPDIVFPQKVREDFIHAFLKLYQQERSKTVNDILKDIFKLQMKYIPDNHFYVYDSDGEFIELSGQEKTDFCTELRDLLKREDIDKCQRGKIEHYLSTPHQVGVNFAVQQDAPGVSNQTAGLNWKTGSIHHNGHNAYVVGISSFVAFGKNGFDKDLIDDFTKLAQQLSKQEYQQSDALIIDLRGNGGGWPYIGDYLARTLYGNTVTSGGASLQRDTLERALISSYMENEPTEKKQALIKKQFSGETIESSDEKWTDRFPFNPQLGFKKPILILTDRETGSNAEATCEKLVIHPYVRFVGENTKGCLQFGSAPTNNTALPLPFGGRVGISRGAGASDTIKGRYEGIGVAPNYSIKTDALTYALEHFDEIQKEIQRDVESRQFAPVRSSAIRENYVEDVTCSNVKTMRNQHNEECAIAVQRLSKTTRTIPQMVNAGTFQKNVHE